MHNPKRQASAGRALLRLLPALLAIGMAGCGGPATVENANEGPLVLDMSHGPVSLVLRAEPRVVDLASDVILSIEITAPTEIEVAVPDLGGRLDGFVLNGAYTEQLSDRGGSRTTIHRARLTPVLSSGYRLAPMAIEYEDRSVSPPIKAWFPTRPVRFETATRPPGGAGQDIQGDVDPVWIPPTFRSVALLVLGLLLLAALLAVGVRLAMKVRRQVQLARMSPRERAMKELSLLLAKDLVGRDRVKDFYVELTCIVRRYIERAHAVRAPEQTTEEFLAAVAGDPRFGARVVATLREFLEAADLVKFAAHRPDQRAVDGAVNTAKDYIETDAAEPERERLRESSPSSPPGSSERPGGRDFGEPKEGGA